MMFARSAAKSRCGAAMSVASAEIVRADAPSEHGGGVASVVTSPRMSHDVFVSYSEENTAVADVVCLDLEATGIRVWMAPRDVIPGMSRRDAIVEAINRSRVMVVIFSAASDTSDQVRRELERAVRDDVTIVGFRIEDVRPSGEMKPLVATAHWVEAHTPPLQASVRLLGDVLRQILDRPTRPPVVVG